MAAFNSHDREVAEFFAEAYRFDFFQAVKLLEAQMRCRRLEDGAQDTLTPGCSLSPDEDSVRFRSAVSMGFRASDLVKVVARPDDDGAPVMLVNFMTLAGAKGPLPHFFAELIRDRDRIGDDSLRSFLDLFNHRLISVFYRARQQHRPTLHTGNAEDHPFGRYIAAISGLGLGKVQEAFDGVSDSRGVGSELQSRDLLLYAGLMWQRDRSMSSLTRILSHFFGVGFRGREACGRWMRLPDDERTCLSTREQHNKLGVTAVAGSRVYDAQSGFELAAGPLTWEMFNDLLPVGRLFSVFLKLVNYFVRSAFDFCLRLTLDTTTMRPEMLSLSAINGPRLGWTSWLLTRPLELPEYAITFRGRPWPQL